MADTVAEVGEILTSVLNTNKRPITLTQLKNEYRQFTDQEIPFRKFGFSTLEELVNSLHRLVKVSRSEGKVVYEAIRKPETAHISDLIRTQKSSKKGTSKASNWKGFSYRRSSEPSSKFVSSQLSSNFSSSRPSSTVQSHRLSRPINTQPRPTLENVKRYSDQIVTTTATKSPPPPVSRRSVSTMTSPIRNGMASPPTDVPSSADHCFSPISSEGKRTIGDLRQDLERLVGDDVKIKFSHSYVPSSSGAVFFAEVAVGSATFKSHPIEKSCVEDALAVAILNALDNLKLNPTPGESDASGTSPESFIQRRLLQVLDGSPGGLFMQHVESAYENIFHESLPANWKIFLNDKWFLIETIFDGRRILLGKVNSKDFIEVQPQDVVEDISQAASSSRASDDASKSENSVFFYDVMSVYVTIVCSTADVWVRPETVWDEYNELVTSMELHYLKSDDKLRLERAENIALGNVYATEADASCSRVKILDILPNEEVRCLFVDHGEINTIPSRDLWVLETKFKTPHFMAMQCQLHGLEGFSSQNSLELFNIVDKTFTAKVVSRENELCSVVLYDTSSDDDLNVNEQLHKLLLREIRPAQLKSTGGGLNNDVYLSHVVDTGHVFLQIHSATFELIDNLVDSTVKNSDNAVGVSSVSQNTVYLAKYSDDLWYRVACISGSVPDEEDMVEVFFVDYGNTDRVHLSHMKSLKGENDTLAQLPYQVIAGVYLFSMYSVSRKAIRCRLYNVPIVDDLEWTKRTSERLTELAPDDFPLIAKVVLDDKNKEFPHVELFKRLQPSNDVVSINLTLNTDESLFAKRQKSPLGSAAATYRTHEAKMKTVVEDRNTSHLTLSSSCSSRQKAAPTVKCLETPTPSREILPVIFPSVGEELDVYVSMAANPFNFMIQSWINGKDLDKLLLDMHNFYETKGQSVTLDGIVNNGLYAFKHDRLWYRVRINHDGSTDFVSVKFIDYGNHEIATVASLRVLEDMFRILPSQIIRASLSGIEPMYGDWLPEDAFIFRKLVEEKNFVARVVSETTLDTDEKQLGVELIDTTSEHVDVYVHNILIEKGIARLVHKDGS